MTKENIAEIAGEVRKFTGGHCYAFFTIMRDLLEQGEQQWGRESVSHFLQSKKFFESESHARIMERCFPRNFLVETELMKRFNRSKDFDYYRLSAAGLWSLEDHWFSSPFIEQSLMHRWRSDGMERPPKPVLIVLCVCWCCVRDVV